MGGRGRGRGRGMSFDPRDMGFGVGEQLPGPVLQPPPTYPVLEHRPVALRSSAEMEYMVAVKKDLAIFLKDNWSQCDGSNSNAWENAFEWRRLPVELRSQKRAKDKKKSAVKKTKKAAFDLVRLDALEKLDENGDEVEREKPGDKEDGEQDENEEDEAEEEDLDEEMDDGTDYVNNYFDNGEGEGEDDDDTANDGPVY